MILARRCSLSSRLAHEFAHKIGANEDNVGIGMDSPHALTASPHEQCPRMAAPTTHTTTTHTTTLMHLLSRSLRLRRRSSSCGAVTTLLKKLDVLEQAR